MELYEFAMELGYDDIRGHDLYDVRYLYVGEDGEPNSMGYCYVCSELLYNEEYAGAIQSVYEQPLDPFSVKYMV